MNYLLDTNIVSEIRKRHPAPEVLAWFESIPQQSLHISALVVGEARRGAELLMRRDPRQGQILRDWVSELAARYGERVLPVTAEIADEWGRLGAQDRLPVVDGLIAATAKVHGFVLATRNVRDIERTGVTWVNPFAASR